MRFLHGVLCRNAKYACFFLIVLCLAFPRMVQALPVGGIVHLKAKVEVRAEKQPGWTLAGERHPLAYGEYIRTDKTGKAELLFNDGTEIDMRNNTQLQILTPASESQSLVVRVFGALSEIFVHARGKTEIRSAACNAAVRGTEFLIRLPSADQTTLTVLDGVVDFYNAHGTVTVGAEQQSTARLGAPPALPTRVDVTGLLSWTADMTGLPVEFDLPMTSLDPGEAAKQRPLAEREATLHPEDAAAHLRLARLCYDSGAADEAVREFDRARQLTPEDSAAWLGLGAACRASGDLPRATDALTHALRLTPESTEAQIALVLTSIAAGDYTKAHTQLATLPDSAQAQALFGLLALREGDPEEAVQRLSTAITRDATCYQAYALLALARLMLNQLPDAEVAARHAVTLQPHDAQAQAALAMVLFFADRIDEAAEVAQRAIRLNPFSPFALLTQGRALAAQGNLSEARNAFQQAQALDPDFPLIYIELGQVYLRLGALPKAEAAFRKALSLHVVSPEAHTGLGVCLQLAGKTREAIAEHEQAMTLDPAYIGARVNLAALYTENGELTKAEALLTLANHTTGAVPSSSAISLTGAVTLVEAQGKFYTDIGAVDQLPRGAMLTVYHNGIAVAQAQIIQVDRLDSIAQLTKAYRSLVLKLGDKVVAQVNHSPSGTGGELPEHGMLYARLALINLYHQHLFAAQTYARRAVELLPRSAIAHFVLGQVYQEQHRVTQAASEYRLATTLDPQYAPARYALGVMRGILETGLDCSHPLGTVDAVSQASPYQALTIQNRQAPGMADRIQAAVQDPTVVRVASRAFGDLQLDGDAGEEHTRDADVSYLHESEDQRGVFGVAASTTSTDGVRANADSREDLLGVSIGRKAADNSSGWFALGQDERDKMGQDVAAVSQPSLVNYRTTRELPYYLLGGNLQSGDTNHTYALVTFERPFEDDVNTTPISLSENYHFDGAHVEVRHDIQLHNNELSLGAAVGQRSFENENTTLITMPPPFSSVYSQSNIQRQDEMWQVYLHDTLHLFNHFTVFCSVDINRLTSEETNTITSNIPVLPVPPSSNQSYHALPALTVAWQPTPQDGVRARAYALDGSLSDYQLLRPTDVLLFPTSDLPACSVGVYGSSYEAEYDHTFPDTSFFRLGFIRQQMRSDVNGALQDADAEPLEHYTYQAEDVSYERVIDPNLTAFTDLSFIRSAAVASLVDFTLLTPVADISDIPHFEGEIGIQYLNPHGWFVQPSYGYMGARWQAYDASYPTVPRARTDAYGVVNLRVGKRWGLHTALFIEVDNLTNQQYTLLSGGSEILQAGRLLRVGFSQRF